MDIYYLVLLLVIMGLAALDLVVGVSNDAVNFLNSSIGSKVAPRWVILTVASAGVLLGALFSNGMMEVARSGVFFPGQFTFPHIMILFLAVMITDVILLDVFNTFALPTSTTVSLVFELLGSAVAVSLVIISRDKTGEILDYINAGKALKIITGIFTAVVIAFTVGIIVMWISRMIFSFNYKKSFKYFGAVWGGFALTSISYFAFFKVLKSSSLDIAAFITYVQNNLTLALLVTFLFWTIVMGVLQFAFKVNILRIIILAGTASLAMAFAGNDLVNFIGVFMAGLSSYQISLDAIKSGVDINTLHMDKLNEPAVANWYILLIAGGIMVLALWFSKKGRGVTETEVNLARQNEGLERFSSVGISRSLVRNTVSLSNFIQKITPQKIVDFVENRFTPLPVEENNGASFDLIRASVNLTISALLISLGTSLKLPLSTTYVTFMVAMGSSLADRAWGRESAVYRITGVLTVIGGWFVTAFVAFTTSLIVALALMYGGKFSVVILLALIGLLFYRFAKLHQKREKKKEELEKHYEDEHEIVDGSTSEINSFVKTSMEIYSKMLEGLFNEDRKKLHKLYKTANAFYGKYKDRRQYEVLPTLQQLKNASLDSGQYYVQLLDYFYEISLSLKTMTKDSFNFIDNAHEGFKKDQIEDLKILSRKLISVFEEFHKTMSKSPSELYNIKDNRAEILDLYADLVKRQIKRTKNKENGTRNSILYLNLLNETKDIASKSFNLMRAQTQIFNTK